jgi:hypothetical protein
MRFSRGNEKINYCVVVSGQYTERNRLFDTLGVAYGFDDCIFVLASRRITIQPGFRGSSET